MTIKSLPLQSHVTSCATAAATAPQTQPTKHLEDILLAQRIIDGDKSAFDKIYQDTYHQILKLCLYKMQDKTLVEDIIQKVYLQVYRHIRTFKGDCPISNWIYRIAINECGMHWRNAIVKNETLTQDGIIPEPSWIGKHIPQQNFVIERIILEEAIAQLPDGCRNVFILHEIDGFLHEEIATIRNCTDGTSKSQLHRARKKLQEILTA